MHRVVHALFILGAKALADHHARAHGQAGKKADQRIDHAARGTHGGQGLLAHEPAHHHAVHGAVQLLKDLPDQHGHREGEQQLPDGSLRHIDALLSLGHSSSFIKV